MGCRLFQSGESISPTEQLCCEVTVDWLVNLAWSVDEWRRRFSRQRAGLRTLKALPAPSAVLSEEGSFIDGFFLDM